MFLLQSQLESVVLRRLEQLRGVQNAPSLGMCQCLSNVLQALNSAAGVEWSSTDGNDEAQQENIQVDLTDASLSHQLSVWNAWLVVDGLVTKAKYFAATHALIQDILNCIIAGSSGSNSSSSSSSEPSISRAVLDAAWQEDVGSGSGRELPSERFKSSLAALATICSSDGKSQTAAACLSTLLTKIQVQQPRWQGLIGLYTVEFSSLPAPDTDATQGAAVAVAVGGGVAGRVKVAEGYGGDGDDDEDDIEALLKEDSDGARDTTPAGLTGAAPAAEAADADAYETNGASGAADASAAATAAVAEEEEEEQDTFSLGLSRAASHMSMSLAPNGDEALATAAAAVATATATAPKSFYTRRAARTISVKSLEDPELRRALSDTSSANLDDLPPEDLEALLERQASHAKSSTRLARQPAACSGGSPGDLHLGHLADMDLRAWAALKDKQPHHHHHYQQQQQHPPASRGRLVPGSGLAPLLGRADAPAKSAMDQHLKATRVGSPGPPSPTLSTGSGGDRPHLHGVSPVRQSMERERGGGAGETALRNVITRNGSNDSPMRPRSRSLGANLSRKLSISEPGPMGQQAEWKHLPALGQATRLHPHQMRQRSRGNGTSGASGGPSRSRGGDCAMVEDKLPSLPALTGARGQPPKAMELLRRPSILQRSDAHHAGSYPLSSPGGHLPGLGPASKPVVSTCFQNGARRLCIQATKKSVQGGDDHF